jgi:hypothetical protein
LRIVFGVTTVLLLLVLLIPVVVLAGAFLGFMVAAGLALSIASLGTGHAGRRGVARRRPPDSGRPRHQPEPPERPRHPCGQRS